ncbi:hypothetical protein H8L32_02475 [Undibacterium sp. CY18W]|uniref:Uncharacterized protein n=1 Tax=Undibacterium hunanense TaxID=2762292 RepID=A0ABR6ZKD0_9BURK|nr:hypothetical protein [Undibacterium hunanense]MBC3916342.1 hypothetical protein [Undibacterium hunanense]
MKRRNTKKNVMLPKLRRPRDFLLPAEKQSWAERLRRVLLVISRELKGPPGIHQANHDTVRRTLIGMGPDSDKKRNESGARMVVNLSSVNVPDFCRHGYKNVYDRQASQVTAAPRISQRRQRVDRALPIGPTVEPKDIYYGAVELAGAGIRYYGDVCLVLKPEAVPASTVILDRNSFDVDRPPVINRISSQPLNLQERARASLLLSWSGTWERDLAAMTTIRLHSIGATSTRRWTIGQIARTLVDDEDYLEVLKQDSFNVNDIQEARLFSADVALDAYISTRTSNVRFEALIWRRRRNQAEAALREAGIPVRVVGNHGRERS